MLKAQRLGLEAQLDGFLIGNEQVVGLILWSGTKSFIEIDHKIFSLVVLSLLLIQDWQLSHAGERM